jgi:hypothetical protein
LKSNYYLLAFSFFLSLLKLEFKFHLLFVLVFFFFIELLLF